MSANICKIDRESVCATCLSQDRKLFSVSNGQACAKFYSELLLTQSDRVCWECHHTARKIVAFKDKAQRAQAWLRAATNSQPSEIPCLSSLNTSTGMFLNITDPGLTNSDTPPPVFVSVKQEVVDDEISSDGVKDDSWNHSAEERDRVTVKEEFEIEIPAFEIHKPQKRKAPAPIEHQGDIYTEERLTEEGLLEWWKKKKRMKYYTQAIPLERCDKCVQPLDGPQLTRGHAKNHTELYGGFECDLCTQRLVGERELEFHKKLHYRLLKCRHCEFVWDDVNAMRQHGSELHGIRQTLWECEQCVKTYPSVHKYRAHLRYHRRVKCPECGNTLMEANLKLHMMQHRGGRRLHAGGGGGQVPRGGGLKRHVVTHNTEVDPVAYCRECETQFRDMILYRVHMKSKKHAAESDFRFKCKECDATFVMRKYLEEHMDIHTDVVYPCDQCDKSFNTKKSRRRHVLTKHSGRPLLRDQLCDYCGKGFTSKVQLSSHINTHTGARPFVCKLCGADFGHKSALYLHGRYKHKIQKIKKNDKVKSNSGKDNSVKDSEKDSSVNDNSEKGNMDT